MKNKTLRISLLLLSMVLVISSLFAIFASAADNADIGETQVHSDYVPAVMYSNDFETSKIAAAGAANAPKTSDLIKVTDGNGSNQYLLFRPNYTGTLPETRLDIWTGARKQGHPEFINLKESGNLTYDCTIPYVIYDFDIGTETDLTDGYAFQILAQRLKDGATKVGDRTVDSQLELWFADDESTGNLLLKKKNGNYIDTGVSIDNEFAHITIVVDLTEVISTHLPSKAAGHVFVNGKNIGLTLTGFTDTAHYFDMARLTSASGSEKGKITDSIILDNYTSRSFGSDYHGNLSAILKDTTKGLTEFDCTVYDANYEMPTVRPLAKIGIQSANTHKELRGIAKSGDVIRYFRPVNHYIPSGIDGVTEHYQDVNGVQNDGVLYETFDDAGKLYGSFKTTDNYNQNLLAASQAVYKKYNNFKNTAYTEIYSDITVISTVDQWAPMVVSFNGTTLTYDDVNSTHHLIYGYANREWSFVGPGTIKALAGYQTKADNSKVARHIAYIQQNNQNAIINFENIKIESVTNTIHQRSGIVNFENCDLSWSNGYFSIAYGVIDGKSYDSPSISMKNCTVKYTGVDGWDKWLFVTDAANVTNGTEYLKTNKTNITVENSIINASGANFIRISNSYSPANNPAINEPTVSLINSSLSCRRFSPVDIGEPTFNIINSKVAKPSIEFFQLANSDISPITNIENSLFGTNPADIKGTVNYLNGNKVLATNSSDYPYIVTKLGVKANMTLNSDFNFNFYVPKDQFVSASVDGVSLTVGDTVIRSGVEYVMVSYEGIAPAEAGVTKTCAIVMTNGEVNYTANYSLSIPKYITKINAQADAGYTDSVRSMPLMASIVNYIDASYAKFGTAEGLDAINALKTLLADDIANLQDYEMAAPVNTVSNLSEYVASTAMIIDSTPKFVVNLNSTFTGTISINGTEYEVKDGKYDGMAYITYNFRARSVSNSLVIKVGDKVGKFNVSAYYNYLNKEGDTASCKLLDALYTYGKEAANYKAHAYDEAKIYIDETYHWYICDDTSCKTHLNKTVHTYDESGICETCGYVYGNDENGNFLNSLGIAETTKTERDDMKFAKILNNSSATYTFTDEEKALVNKGDVLLFSFVAKADGASVAMNINADVGTVINGQYNTTSMTYYIPVQWTRIYMPIANNGMNKVTLETAGNVQIAEAKYENLGNIDIETLNLKSGMWMIDDFEKYELKVNESYLSDTGISKYASSIKLSKDGTKLFAMSYSGNGTFAVYDANTGALIAYKNNLGKELRQLAITEDENYAVMTSRAYGATIIDMTKLGDATPTLSIASTYNTVELATGLYIDGNYAFITNRYHGVEVVDISDPTKPVQKANIYTGGEVQSCVVYNGYLYCGVWGECGVWIYDLKELETTSNLTRVGKVVCNGKGDGLTVTTIGSRTYMFAATGQHTYGADPTSPFQELDFGQGNGLDIFDVTDPANPIHLSTSKIDGRYYYTGSDFWEADVTYDEATGKYYAYLVNTYNGVYVYDVTNLSAPVRLAHITLPLYNGKVLSHATRTIITSWDQNKEARSAVASIAVKDGIIYVSGADSDIHKLNSAKLFHNEYESSSESVEVQVGDVYANLNTGLANGTTFWSENNGQVLSVATKGDYIYVAAGSDGILVFEKNGFNANSTPIYTYPPKIVNGRVGFAVSIEIKGDKLYSAEDVAGLGVYSIGADGSLTEIEGYRYTNSSYVVRQVRVSPNGGYAVIQLNSSHVAVVELKSDNKYGAVTIKSLDGGHGYHKNLSEVINGRYIIAWNHVAFTYWIDFNPQNGVDSAPVFVKMENSPMSTMTNGIAAYGDQALVMPSWGNSYRLYSDISTYTGGFADVGGKSFSGKPTVCGKYLIFTRHDSGMIYILDISDIEAPKLVHTIDTVGNADIAYYDGDGNVYIPLGNQGLLVINLNEAF